VEIKLPDREMLAKITAEYEPNEDFEAAIETFELGMEGLKIAIEEFPLYFFDPVTDPIRHRPFTVLDPGESEEKEAPHVMLTLSEGGLPLLFIRAFKKDGDWICDTKCNLIGMSLHFACAAEGLLGKVEQSDSESRSSWRTLVARRTADMLQSAFRRLEAQTQITTTSFLKETVWKCAELCFYLEAQSFGLHGVVIKRVNFQKLEQERLKEHHEAIQTIWKDASPEKLLDQKKQLLALYYEQTLAHWKEMERMQSEGKDWRQYVKAVPGVTDHLVETFEKDLKISHLAIEHAAQRAELYNIFEAKPKAVEERKGGNRISGYGRSRLFQFKKEGWELLRQKGVSGPTRS